ncbi:MAG TPA: SUMF1/EgtB/PvdO family nonheme iron enzyme [Terracidiphilus sp.]|nr:SUMF1/EgtB/PvdO family nonheme iron enzyme [Terracidiphilus sp.]
MRCDSAPLYAQMGLPATYARPAAESLHEAARAIRGETQGGLLGIMSDRQRQLLQRLAAGMRVALEGWRPQPILEPSMLDVPGGTASIGTEPDEVEQVVAEYASVGVKVAWIRKETPRHSVDLAPYRIAKYPVTCDEFAQFCAATGFAHLPSTWNVGRRFHPVDANTPVSGVSLESAEAYCRWLSGETGRSFQLPTEPEWEFAAAGPQRLEFPWGNRFNPDCANTLEVNLRMPSPVGVFPGGASWVGAMDLAGNVEEWTSSRIGDGYPGGVVVEEDLVEALGFNYPVCRGGSFCRFADLARCRRRHGPYPGVLYPIGFRLAEHVVTNHRKGENK